MINDDFDRRKAAETVSCIQRVYGSCRFGGFVCYLCFQVPFLFLTGKPIGFNRSSVFLHRLIRADRPVRGQGVHLHRGIR